MENFAHGSVSGLDQYTRKATNNPHINYSNFRLMYQFSSDSVVASVKIENFENIVYFEKIENLVKFSTTAHVSPLLSRRKD